MQRSVGAVELMVGPGERQMARDWMPDQHRDFYAQLPFVVLGTVDETAASLDRRSRRGLLQLTDDGQLGADRATASGAGME